MYVVNALDFCYDEGIVGIGNMNYTSSGGGNLFIVRVDRFNTGGNITVISETTNEIITLSYDDISRSDKLKVYPTIFTTNISIEGLPLQNQIFIYNSVGQLINTINNTDGNLQTEFLPKGLYILKIKTDTGIYTNKVIKN